MIALAGAPLAACNRPEVDALDLAASSGTTGSYAALKEPQPLVEQRPPGRPELDRKVVDYFGPEPPGTIVVRIKERRLYLVQADGTAVSYPVGVGKTGKKWVGEAYIESKHIRPAWSPPAEVRADNPALPDVIPSGATNNPMGERALVLQDEYAIHGTNRPESIGTYATYGCIRMFNEDIVDLFDRVRVGTPVYVEV
jgi:lipoprotein-anchoring transpeptidase ErfK/SrfK